MEEIISVDKNKTTIGGGGRGEMHTGCRSGAGGRRAQQ